MRRRRTKLQKVPATHGGLLAAETNWFDGGRVKATTAKADDEGGRDRRIVAGSTTSLFPSRSWADPLPFFFLTDGSFARDFSFP